MEKFFLRKSLQVLIVSCTGFILSCSGVVVDEVQGIDSNTHLTGHFSQYDNAKISGSGSLRFNAVSPLGSNRSLTLRTSLDGLLSGSSVTAVLFSPQLMVNTNTGVAINFTRNGASVSGSISVNGTSVAINSARLNFFYPANIDIVIDVHNQGGRTRVLIWRRDVTIYAAETADVDSDRSGDLNGNLPAFQVGGGTFNGLHLNFATVSAAIIGPSKVLN